MVANNNALHGKTCRGFVKISVSVANGNGNIFVFELEQSQYIEYVLAIGQGLDHATYPTKTDLIAKSDCSSTAYGNRYWFSVKIYVGNNTVVAGNEFCGYAGAENRHQNKKTFVDANGDEYDFDF